MPDKKQFTIYNWCSEKEVHDKLATMGLKHNDKIDEDLFWKFAKDAWELRLNVMLLHSGDNVVVGLDNSKFGQR